MDEGEGFSLNFQQRLQEAKEFQQKYASESNVVADEAETERHKLNVKLLHHIDWRHVHDSLSHERTRESYAKRMSLWKQVDLNGNGQCSFSELEMGIEKLLDLNHVMDLHPPILKAFTVAKNFSGRQSGNAAEFVQKSEFRVFLEYLQKYFELFVMFLDIDENFDNRISPFEFKAAVPKLKSWGLQLKDNVTAQIFHRVDKDSSGMIQFDEFAEWAI